MNDRLSGQLPYFQMEWLNDMVLSAEISTVVATCHLHLAQRIICHLCLKEVICDIWQDTYSTSIASNLPLLLQIPLSRQKLFFSDHGLEIYSPTAKYVTRTWDSLSLCNSPYHPLFLTPEGCVKVRWHIYYEITYWTSLSLSRSVVIWGRREVEALG